MIALDAIAGLGAFRGVPREAIAALGKRATEMTFATGEVLFAADSTPRGWYVVISGNVRVMGGSAERPHVVHVEGAGGTLGEVPLFSGATHPATGIATEPTRCALITRAALEEAIAETPSLAFVLLARLAQRVRHLVDRLDGRSSHGVRARLAAFLLSRTPQGRSSSISLGMTQQGLAEELGTVRTVVSREIRALCHGGLMRSLGGGRYLVIDAARLVRLVD